MSNTRRGRAGRSGLSRTLCVCCATYFHLTATLAQTGSQTDTTAVAVEEMTLATGVDLIPSVPRTALIAAALKTSTKFPTGLIPSAPRTSSIIPSEPIARFPTGLIPSAPRSSSMTPTAPSAPDMSSLVPSSIASTLEPTGLVPSAPISPVPQSTTLGTVPSTILTFPIPTNGTNVVPTILPTGMTSTQEGLHPIPAPSTNPGDPDGHHEIPEPNFTITLPCRGCSPVVEITATGWGTAPSFPVNVSPAQEVETKASSSPAAMPIATLSVGPSNVIVKPEPSGGDFVIGDSTTVKLGQTVTVAGSPVAVHTSNGHIDVVIGGTQTVPLQPPYNPPAATVTVGGSPIVVKPAPSGGNFVVGDSTVAPGQTITVSNTPIAVQTNGPLAQVVAGTQTIPLSPQDARITDAPAALPIPLANGATITPLPPQTDTSNVQGYVLSSQTLLPGGPPIVVQGTTYSLAADATALLVNGETTTLHPAYGALLTSVAAAPLTLWGHVYAANRAGYYSLAPGATLVPGGPAVTVSGSIISLEAHGTAVVIQGSTSAMQPVTAVVTVMRSEAGGMQGTETGMGEGEGAPLPTVGKDSGGVRGVWVEGIVVLGVLVVGWLGICL